MSDEWPMTVNCHDILDGTVDGSFDGVFIVDSPALESQAYASKPSLEGHVNCKIQADIKVLLLEFIENVFIFSMTGIGAMLHDNMALCCGKRPSN